MSIPGLPPLDRPRCPACGAALDLTRAVPLTEKTTDRFDAQTPRVSGFCCSTRPFAIEEDGTVRPADMAEIAMLIIARPEIADVFLELAAEKLPPDKFVALAKDFADIRRRYPRQKRSGPPG